MNTVNDRIGEIMIHYKLNQKEIALKLGTSQAYLSAIITGKRGVGASFLKRIYNHFPEIKKYWLLTGEGCMFDDDVAPIDENKKILDFLLEKTRLEFPVAQIAQKTGYSEGTISPYLNGKIKPSRKFLQKFAESFGIDINEYEEPKRAVPKVTFNESKGRPFYNADWTLGFKDLNDDTVYYPEFNIDFPPANRDSVEWFPVKGNSMLGEINSGDYVALEEIIDFSWFPLGRVYGVVTNNGFRTIKRVSKSDNNENYCLISSNPDKEEYPDQDIPKNMIVKLFKVVFVIKDLDE